MATMENGQDLVEQPAKKAKMQEPREESISQVGNSDDEKADASSGLPTNHRMPSELLPCTDYAPRANDFTSQMYPAKPYTHILSVPVAESMTTYNGQTPYQALQPSQPYTAYPQGSQNYGLPPFGALWPGIKSESGLIQATNPPAILTCSSGISSQSSPVLYSYPVQATNVNTISSPSSVSNISSTTSISNQEYPTYTILGQNQYQQCYPNQSFSAATTSSVTESSSVITPAFQQKPEATTLAQGTQRPASGDNAESQQGARAMGSKEIDDQSRKSIHLKNRGKGKKADSSSLQDGDLERVFLWDLDETIIIFHSLLTGSYAQKYGKDPSLVVGSGLAMEEMIFEVADTHLFFNDLEECDQVHVEDVASDDNGQDLSNYSFSTDGFNGSAGRNHASNSAVQGGIDWMRKLAFRYRKVIEVYDKYKNNVCGLLSPQRRDSLQRLRADIEVLTDGWLGTALKCLLLIQSRKNCVNVLITTTQLVPALAKVLLYGLGEVFPIENIYSATKIGKESCFERIVTRFGKKVTYVVIGDGRDEEMAAKQHNMPFWRITNHNDLISLHQALELDFL
ncbi:eyes absent homolog 3 isoform X1 [Bombina bombina]|uniref:eyes absent homolog 3 isoform X1 n=1 Tax=Bombina bombina TaxID=8345 RepID=UPI00235A908D|nr:eyes absent homolog 3 isoform X1 [Bombina bombina]